MMLMYLDRAVRDVCCIRIYARFFSKYDSGFIRNRRGNEHAQLNIKKLKYQSRICSISCNGNNSRKSKDFFGFHQGFKREPKYFPYSHLVKFLTFRMLCHTSENLDDIAKYEEITNETLESISEYFEELVASEEKFPDADVSLSAGVLTIYLSEKNGTYVINRQAPNRQIWLSSPLSGPKRYDWIDGCWVYKHDQVLLHELLSQEMSILLKKEVDFTKCSYGTANK